MLLLLKFKSDLIGEVDVTDKKTSWRACEEKAIFIKLLFVLWCPPQNNFEDTDQNMFTM